MANTISDAGIKRLQATVTAVDGLLGNIESGQGIRRASGATDWFEARITGWVAIIANARWRYAWEQILIENDNDIIYSGGLSGTTTDYYALNYWEMNNIAAHTGAQADGIPQNSPNYPTNYQLIPIGGGTGTVANQAVVMMKIVQQTSGLFRPVFWAQNGHFGSCA